jgi:formylmethanofuran dehydrogenase subunit E
MTIHNEIYEKSKNKCKIIMKFMKSHKINENNKNVISNIKEMEINDLNIILSSIFASTKITTYKCDICNNYTASNNKSLTNHKRMCKQKNQQKITENTLESSTESSNDKEKTIESNKKISKSKK